MSVKIGCTWTNNSDGQSSALIMRRSQVQVLLGPLRKPFLFPNSFIYLLNLKPFGCCHRGVQGSPLFVLSIYYLLLEGLPTLLLYIMSWSGKNRIIQKLRNEAGELRKWMSEHTSPSTPASEFCEVANKYAIICTKIYVIEKQW